MSKSIFKPTKIICVGLNYRSHAEEMKDKLPDNPILFIKPPSSLIFNNDTIVMPGQSQRVDHEAELAVVIGKKCKNAKKENALDFVQGYTCLNDVTARDLQKLDGQWTRAKGFDTFCPVGPEIIKLDNPNDLFIKCRVNGEERQSSRTSSLIFNVEDLIAFISGIMTLEIGDIIATGTPSGISPLKDNDIVEVEIEKIGILKNRVKTL